jgi:hypothetical protein
MADLILHHPVPRNRCGVSHADAPILGLSVDANPQRNRTDFKDLQPSGSEVSEEERAASELQQIYEKLISTEEPSLPVAGAGTSQ